MNCQQIFRNELLQDWLQIRELAININVNKKLKVSPYVFPKRIGDKIETSNRSYTVEEILGAGIQGSVYSVRDSTGQKYTLKVLHNTLSTADLLERHLLMDAWSHPGTRVTRVVDSDTEIGVIVFEYFRGIPLDSLYELAANTSLPKPINDLIDASKHTFVNAPQSSLFEKKNFNTAFDIDTQDIVFFDPY